MATYESEFSQLISSKDKKAKESTDYVAVLK